MAYPLPSSGLYNSPIFQTFLANHPTFARIARTGSARDLQKFLASNQTIANRYMAILNPAKPAAQPGAAPAAAGQTTAQKIEDGTAPAVTTPDWVDELNLLFKQNGLDSLAGTLTGLVQQGYTGSALTLALQDSDAYKTRFSANEARKKAGLRVLSPAEYLSAEESYRQVMSAAGLPSGFYDSQDDFTKFIANDTSAQELQGRVSDYVQVAKNTDPAYRKMIQDTFGVGLTDGDIAAFMIDPGRAYPLLDKTVNAIGVANAARQNGLAYSQDRAMQLAEQGVTTQQADQAYGQIADLTSAFGRAGKAFGTDYTQTDAENESLLGLASAKRKREKTQSAFEAYNSGASQASKSAFSKDTNGSY